MDGRSQAGSCWGMPNSKEGRFWLLDPEVFTSDIGVKRGDRNCLFMKGGNNATCLKKIRLKKIIPASVFASAARQQSPEYFCHQALQRLTERTVPAASCWAGQYPPEESADPVSDGPGRGPVRCQIHFFLWKYVNIPITTRIITMSTE